MFFLQSHLHLGRHAGETEFVQQLGGREVDRLLAGFQHRVQHSVDEPARIEGAGRHSGAGFVRLLVESQQSRRGKGIEAVAAGRRIRGGSAESGVALLAIDATAGETEARQRLGAFFRIAMPGFEIVDRVAHRVEVARREQGESIRPDLPFLGRRGIGERHAELDGAVQPAADVVAQRIRILRRHAHNAA